MSRIPTVLLALLLSVGAAQATVYSFTLSSFVPDIPPEDGLVAHAGDTLLTLNLPGRGRSSFQGEGCFDPFPTVLILGSPMTRCIENTLSTALSYDLTPDADGLAGRIDINLFFNSIDLAGAGRVWAGTWQSDDDVTGCSAGAGCSFTGLWSRVAVPGPSEFALLLVGFAALAAIVRASSSTASRRPGIRPAYSSGA